MTPKERMITAYRGEVPDTVPVAPEFWYYLPARLLKMDMLTFETEMPLWQGLHETFKHYKTEGWGVVMTDIPTPNAEQKVTWTDAENGRKLKQISHHTPHGDVQYSIMYDPVEPSWHLERAVKDFEKDWQACKAASMGDIQSADWSEVNRALRTVGDDYLLEVWLGVPFFDYIAGNREGGLQQGIFDLMEYEDYLEELQTEYIDYMRRLTRAVFTHTTAEAVCLGCSWSCVSLIGPSLWRKWDKPVIRAIADTAHEMGKLLHIHFHGKSKAVLEDLAECGADCICPFERPPGGDITDMAELRSILKDRVTVNGNVHTVETLIRGSADDVRKEVVSIFEQWGADPRRLILGTGDQVGVETPDENIYAMIETAREYGQSVVQKFLANQKQTKNS